MSDCRVLKTKILLLCVVVVGLSACRSETVAPAPPVAPAGDFAAPSGSNSTQTQAESSTVSQDVAAIPVGVAPTPPADPPTVQTTAEEQPVDPPENPPLEWVERVTGGANPEAPLPMIVAVHGLGDKPETFIRVFEGLDFPARVIAPRATDRYGNGYSWFVIGAQALDDQTLVDGLEDAAETVTLWTARMIRKRPTVGKPILTGYSQGGMIAFAAAAKYPALFQAIYPISGLLPASLLPDQVENTAILPRIRAFHGQADTRVPYAEADRAIAKLRAIGYDAAIRGYPDVPHRLTAVMWRDLLGELRQHNPQGAPEPPGDPAAK